MESVLALTAFLAFIGFRQWLAHQRRILVHRERMLAIEKGVELPPLEQEVRRSNFNAQRIFLLAGCIWIALGIAAYVTLTAVLAYPSPATADVPRGIQYTGIAGVGVGLAHLIVFLAGRNKVA